MIKRTPKLTRREMIKGLGASAFIAPLLSELPKSYAQANTQEFPKRLILFYTPNGTKKELWRPSHEPGPLTELGPLLSPLNPFINQLTLIDGLDSKAALEGPGGPHQRGMASLFSGAVITEGDFVGGDGRRAGWGGGITIDQWVANQIGTDTPFRSLELGIRVKDNMPRGRISYLGAEQPLPPENDPTLVYQRIFGEMNEDAATVSRRLRRRRSVLDATLQSYQELSRKVGAGDRAKLQLHAERLRELERRLSIDLSSASCQPNTPTAVDNVLAEERYGDLAYQQVELLVSALSCGKTSIASLQCSTAVNALRLNFLEPVVSHEGHSLSHAGDSNTGMQTQWDQSLTWYSQLFNHLLTRLSEVPEGEGTLLDNTVVVWASEISRGNTHDLTDIPFVVAGSCGGGLRTGQYLRYDGIPHNRLLVALAQGFGLELEQFGAPHLSDGILSEILA